MYIYTYIMYIHIYGSCFCESLSFSDLFEPPEEGKGIGFPRKHVILADCTT